MLDVQTTDSAAPLIAVNTTTKAELLSRAKAAIEAGEQSLQEAAEALAVAQDLHGASQAEMARAVGKSEAWVSYLLQWRRTGYKAESPFGPRTKSGRLKHAEERAASGLSKPRKTSTQSQADADNAQGGTEKRKTDYAKLKGNEAVATSNEVATSTVTLADFTNAVDTLFLKLSWNDQCEAFTYIKKKMAVSCPNKN